MSRDFRNRRGFFQPGQQQVIVKKPTLQAINNLAVTATQASANSATNSASAAIAQVQQISAQKQAAANISLAQQTMQNAQANTQKNTTQQATQVKAQKPAQNQTVNFGRFSRGGPVDPNNEYTVHGKTIDEYQAEEAAAKKAAEEATKAASELATGSKGGAFTAIVGPGSTQKNTGAVYYDIDENLKAMYKEALTQGIKVNAPTTYGQSLKTEAAAKAAQQSYIDYLDKQYTAYNASLPVTVYDDLGRAQSISQSQLAQMEAAQKSKKSSGTYTVLPEEVANSGANWWINSNGLYEWVPVTAGDKAHLNQINKQRAQFHQAPKTTLTAGASPSEEYSSQWYSTGGNRTQAARNTKLATLKASSSINNSASAKSNTAQQQKSNVISTSETSKRQAAAQAQRKAEAVQAAEAAKKAEALASQAKAEAAAKAKLVTQAQAAAKKTADPVKKAELQKEVKALEKDSNTAKKASKAADANAKASESLATATKKAASSSSPVKTIELNKAVNSAKAKVEKASTAAQKAGVQDHTGQILLKDGTWINTIQKQGAGGKGEKSVKVFSTTKEYQQQLAAEYKNKLAGKSTPHTLNPVYAKALTSAKQAKAAEAAEAKRLAAAYVPVLAATGQVIDAVQSKSLHGAGEAGVRVIRLDKNNNIIAASKTAKQIHEENKFFNEKIKLNDGSTTTLDKLPITSQTSKATADLIKEARAYKLAHTSNVNKKSLQATYVGLDSAQVRGAEVNNTSAIEKNISSKINAAGSWLEKHSKKGTAASRNAAELKALATGDLSTNLLAISDNFMSVSNRGLSSAILPVFNRLDYINSAVDSALSSTSISINDKGKIFIDRKGSENKNSKVVYNAKVLKDNSKTAQLASKGYDYVKYKPASALVDVGKAYAGGAAFGAATKTIGLGSSLGLLKVSEKLGTGLAAKAVHSAASQTERAINLAMLGGLAVDMNELRKNGDYEAAAKTLVTLSIGGFGYKRGDKAGIKAVDTIRKVGKTKAPIEEFVAPEVLSGKEQIPVVKQGTPVRKVVQSFKDVKTGENIGYHVSPSQIFPRVRSKVSRPSDQAGLYVSPLKSGASIYFTRAGEVKAEIDPFSSLFRNTSDLVVAVQGVTKKDIAATAKTLVNRATGKGGTYTESIIKLKQTVKNTPGNVVTSVLGGATPLPTVNKIHLNKVQRMPESIRYDLKKTQAAMNKASPGEAFITYKFERNIKVGKAEAEATLTPGTILKKLKSDRYFEYNGRVVTLNEYKALEGKGKIQKGEMKKRELSAAQKKELVKNYTTKKPSKRLKSSSSSRKAVSRGLKVPSSSVKNTKPSKIYSQKTVKSSYKNSISSRKGSLSSSASVPSRRSVTPSRSVAQYSPSRKSTTPSKSSVSSRRETPTRKNVKPSRIEPSSRKEIKPYRREPPTRKDIKPSRKAVEPSRIEPSARRDAKPSRIEPPSRKDNNPSRIEPQASSGYGGKEDWPIIWSSPETGHWHPPVRARRTPYSLGKVQKGTTKNKKDYDRLKFHRNIKNTLGSMSSFLGGSTPKKATARSKSVKTNAKKQIKSKKGK